MDERLKTVYVLGAGFTKAFVPDAPLLVDKYNISPLLKKFKSFPTAIRILELERDASAPGKINIERLMTRLDSLMPYDFERGDDRVFGLLLSDIKQILINRIEGAKREEPHKDKLARLAKFVVENGVDCITFNYDDVFDKALYRVLRDQPRYLGRISEPHWHPDEGYGFFLRPSLTVVKDTAHFLDVTSMLCLKLHGSVNWYAKRGHAAPHSVDSLVHHESWFEYFESEFIPGVNRQNIQEAIPHHLEPDPFIVPPVLDKSALANEPILRLVWSQAYENLKQAVKVVFVGYSFPETDLAARFLFKETLDRRPQPEVSVVDYDEKDDRKHRKKIKSAYKEALPFMDEKQFDFCGALEWSKKIVANHLSKS